MACVEVIPSLQPWIDINMAKQNPANAIVAKSCGKFQGLECISCSSSSSSLRIQGFYRQVFQSSRCPIHWGGCNCNGCCSVPVRLCLVTRTDAIINHSFEKHSCCCISYAQCVSLVAWLCRRFRYYTKLLWEYCFIATMMGNTMHSEHSYSWIPKSLIL